MWKASLYCLVISFTTPKFWDIPCPSGHRWGDGPGIMPFFETLDSLVRYDVGARELAEGSIESKSKIQTR